MNSQSLKLPSFAKVNWGLRVLGKRADGYHEVRTTLQTISLKDELEFELTKDGIIRLTCNEPDLPIDDRNLVVRAANALKQRYQVTEGARIHLDKMIPTQAGLGGGSSNAAVSLLALTNLWGLSRVKADLVEIGSELGADVPFFLFGGCALGTGTGATISPSVSADESFERHLVVITPKASVSTAKAYASLNLPALTTPVDDPILSSLQNVANSDDLPPWSLCDLSLDDLQNDFEAVIFDIEPEIRRAKDKLRQSGALGTLLAGSGSSVFGIFADREAQQRAMKVIDAESGWRIFPCVTLTRDDYRRQIGPELFHFFEQG
ncbi:MAG TPA: 4-(cytidine 5'-diphospho)-2-C-methyl-D-erythritol kinase [Pyrinomonadaceae bacterium]|nr:4-(cytidine 5'-diphospho)-2-C-methyl-D-erythritol kinase [Pyrinomonadaceae bacterium]